MRVNNTFSLWSNFEQRYFPGEPGAGHLAFLFVLTPKRPKTLGVSSMKDVGWSLLELTDAIHLKCVLRKGNFKCVHSD